MQDFIRISQAVMDSGRLARERQKLISRSYKKDGSVLTDVDLEIEKFLTGLIREEFPEANIVSEEVPSDFKAGQALTFTIDPIDGTDSYSQGMPGWCVGVGILDKNLSPIGGIISAPRWGDDPESGLFCSALPDFDLSWHGYPEAAHRENRRGGNQLMVGSKVHRRYEYGGYPGKIRSLGSSILHILSPIVHPAVEGAFIPPCFIWDIAPAHAVILRAGMKLRYFNDTEIDYSTMVHRQPAAHHMICGSEKTIGNIKNYFTPRDAKKSTQDQ